MFFSHKSPVLYNVSWQILTEISLSEHPSTREILEKDEAALALQLEGIIKSDIELQTVFALRGEDAHCFLNLLQMVIPSSLFNDVADNITLMF